MAAAPPPQQATSPEAAVAPSAGERPGADVDQVIQRLSARHGTQLGQVNYDLAVAEASIEDLLEKLAASRAECAELRAELVAASSTGIATEEVTDGPAKGTGTEQSGSGRR